MEVTIETVSVPLSHSLTVIGLNVKLFSLDWIPWLATDIFSCDVYVLGTAARLSLRTVMDLKSTDAAG